MTFLTRISALIERRMIFAGIAVLGSLVAVALSATPHLRPDLLWTCYVAALVIGLGMVAGAVPVVVLGWFHLAAVGLPVFAVNVLLVTKTTWAIQAAHWVPLLLAAPFALRERPAARLYLRAYALFLASLALSYAFTPPVRNVNFLYAPPRFGWLGGVTSLSAWRAIVLSYHLFAFRGLQAVVTAVTGRR